MFVFIALVVQLQGSECMVLVRGEHSTNESVRRQLLTPDEIHLKPNSVRHFETRFFGLRNLLMHCDVADSIPLGDFSSSCFVVRNDGLDDVDASLYSRDTLVSFRAGGNA